MNRAVIRLASIAIALAGGVFFLQGLRVLPSRLMYGEPLWVVVGAAMVAVGGVALVWVQRNPVKP